MINTEDFFGEGYGWEFEKSHLIREYIAYFFNITVRMFQWENLPEEIPVSVMERFVQRAGKIIFTKENDKYYVFFGGHGGIPDEYYRPTQFIVNNPYLKLNKTYTIFGDAEHNAVLLKNDTMSRGLYGIHKKYASLLTECDLSQRVASVNNRNMAVITVDTDKDCESANDFYENLEQGKLKALVIRSLGDGTNIVPIGNQTNITQIIEQQQYLKASWFNTIALQANYNMKRETISASESAIDNDSLGALADDMLKCRKHFCEKINDMFGLNVEVDFSDAWSTVKRNEIIMENIEESISGTDTPEGNDIEPGQIAEPEIESSDVEEPQAEPEPEHEAEQEDTEEPTEEDTADATIEIKIEVEEEVEETDAET